MKKTVLLSLFAMVLVVLFAGTPGCSSSETVKQNKETGANKLTFYNEKDDGKYYEVGFDKNNRITSLYIDGKEIPESDYKLYRDNIDEKLYDLRGGKKDKQVWSFNYDPGDYQAFNDDSTRHHYRIFKQFNDSALKDQMSDLKHQLSNMKKYKIQMNFDSDKFRKEMEDLRIKIKPDLEEDLRNLNKDIKEMTKELREKDFDLDEIEVEIPDVSIEIEKLDKKLEGLDTEMSKLKTELKNLDNFMDDVRKELFKDGIIKSEDEDFSMNLNKDGMEINDKQIPKDKFLKYKELYKKHFGKELTDDQKFQIQN